MTSMQIKTFKNTLNETLAHKKCNTKWKNRENLETSINFTNAVGLQTDQSHVSLIIAPHIIAPQHTSTEIG